METNLIWNLEVIQLKITKLEWPQQRVDANWQTAAILSAILIIVRQREKNILKLEPEFGGSNPYMKFKRNPIKND